MCALTNEQLEFIRDTLLQTVREDTLTDAEILRMLEMQDEALKIITNALP